MPIEDWDKHRISNLKYISIVLVVSATLAMINSCNFFGILQNPADPNSPNYQGYIVVDTLDKVVPMAPKGALTFPPTLYSAKLIGGSAYRFQICIEESFVKPEYEIEQSGNIFTPTEWIPSLGTGNYRFRVQAKKDSTWGPWSISEVFSISSEGNISPPDFSATSGIYASSQQVIITVSTPGALIRYTTDGTNPSTTYGVLYSAPVQASTSLVLKAIAYKPGWRTSEISSASYTINGAVPSPSIIPNGGTFTGPPSVTITTETQGASIRYTIDGSTPSASLGLPYTGAFTISSSCTIRAVTYKQDWLDSGIASSVFTITGTIATPSFSPATGTYTSSQQITLSTSPADATIRYTIDGSNPSETAGTIYSGPFQISNSTTIKAIAYKTGWITSQVASGTYTVTGTVATPTFSPGGGTYTTAQEVSISCAVNGATIRYTIDGSAPSKTNGSVYSSPIPINSSTTLKAIAYKQDWKDSDIATSLYDINIQTADLPIPIEMVLVESGVFNMGSNSGGADEAPVHQVTISTFYISKYEITQSQFKDILDFNPSNFNIENKTFNHPVEEVNWFSAVEFCNKLSLLNNLEKVYQIINRIPLSGYPIISADVVMDLSKNGYRLPTESEWEFAARGGINSQGYLYPGSNDVDSIAWYSGNSGQTTHKVGTKNPNELGIYDLAGNVYEWCWDWSSTSYPADPQIDPVGSNIQTSDGRAVRGGDWIYDGYNLRSTQRIAGNRPATNHGGGFRIVKRGFIGSTNIVTK
jgi:formylglycine-generating enzyme required for sulfatase activity